MVAVAVFTFKNHFKVLVLTDEQRNLAMPDVPTAKELGYNNWVASSWNGLAVPVKTPKAMVQRFNKEINNALYDPQTEKKFSRAPYQSQSIDPSVGARMVFIGN